MADEVDDILRDIPWTTTPPTETVRTSLPEVGWKPINIRTCWICKQQGHVQTMEQKPIVIGGSVQPYWQHIQWPLCVMELHLHWHDWKRQALDYREQATFRYQLKRVIGWDTARQVFRQAGESREHFVHGALFGLLAIAGAAALAFAADILIKLVRGL